MDQCKVGGRVSFEEDDNGATGLIVNLSHPLLNVRVRALKSIISKIDCGLIRPESLSYRVDLLQKLHSFLSSDVRDLEGLQFTLKLLLTLAIQKDFREIFKDVDFEKHLNKLRFDVSEEIGAQIDEILDAVDGYFSQSQNCDLIMKSSNYSVPYSFHSSISSSFDHGDFVEDHSYHNLSSDLRDEDKSLKKKSSVVDQDNENSFLAHHYFPPQCYNDEDPFDETETWLKKPPTFEIPVSNLESSDRRVVASTIESLMSKNEPLIFITCSFFRDILLSDFPSENFLQEPSLLLELIQVVEDPLEDKRLNYISFQCLLNFSYKLRIRFQRLNSTDYYHSSNGFPAKGELYNERHSLQTNSDHLCSNMCKVLKSISRYIYYKAKRKTYIILQDFSFTLLTLTRIFPINTKELFLNLQEILQDLRHGFEKNPNHPIPLALTISNLLSSIKKNLNEEEPLILSRDIRRFIKNLCSSKFLQNYPDVFKRLIETASPYEPSLKPIHEKLGNSSEINVEELIKLIDDIDLTSSGRENYWEREESSYQYALDSYPLKNSGKMSREESSSGAEDKRGVNDLLYDIQNATGHKGVLNALESLWETSLVLMLNGLKLELKIEEEWKEGPWRDSFFRFLSVEPTSREDEQLLTNILDFFTFFLRVVKDGRRYGEWIIPLCLEKGCVGLRMITQPSNKVGLKSNDVGSTFLPSIKRAWLDLYNVVLLNPSFDSLIDDDQLWELFSTYVFILEDVTKNDYLATVILPFVFEALAILTSKERIIEKLKKNYKLMISLTHLSCQAISFVEKKVSDGSNRNCGIVHHSSALLHHLTLLLAREDKDMLWDYLGKSYEVIPFLWSSQDPSIRAYGFQICSILTSVHKGFSVLLLGLQSTLLLWSSAYSHVMDLEEVAIVKERAIEVLLNFLTYWKEFGENDLSLSGPKILDDSIRILNNLTWEAEMSSLISKTKKVSKDVAVTSYSGSGDADTLKCFITPRVVIGLCKFLEKLCSISSPKITRDSSNSSLAVTLFGLLGSNKMVGSSRPNWWNNSCSALSCILETLISLSQSERCVSLIIIGDRINFSKMMKLFSLKPLSNGKSEIPSVLSCLWINMFTLLSVLLSDSGTHFEDIERHIFTHRSFIIPRLIDWLSCQSGVKCRKSALNFIFRFLSMLSAVSKDKREKTYHFLCTIWEEREMTYGASIASSLIDIYEDSLEHEEKIEILKSLAALFSLSPSAQKFAIDHDFVGTLIEKIRVFSMSCFEPSEFLHGKKNLNHWQEETFWVLSILSSILYSSKEGKESALANNLSDSVHKIFKYWMLNTDRTILLAFFELFINFTDEFTNGVHSMILTTNMIGVAPRKAPTSHSIFVEFLSILINELEIHDKNPNLKTIEMSFILLQNCCSLPESRTIIIKSQLLNFIGKLHLNETKKWNVKQNHIKQKFLDFLVRASFHADVQLAIPKIPEATEILLLLIDFESPPVSTLALKLIRNLCFQPGNRARFNIDCTVMLAMSAKLRHCEAPEETECAALSLSALIANSEKGKLLAKKSDVPRSILTALHRFKKSEKKYDGISSQEKKDHSSLIQLLTNLGSLLNGCE